MQGLEDVFTETYFLFYPDMQALQTDKIHAGVKIQQVILSYVLLNATHYLSLAKLPSNSELYYVHA